MKKFTIKKEDTNKRLDKFLKENLSDFSRSKIQKMIKEGIVTVNDKKTTAHYFLKEKDQVKINKISKIEKSSQPSLKKGEENKKNTSNIPPLKKGVRGISNIILHKEKDFFIINKPAGMLVHPTDKKEKDTLVNLLIKKHPALKKIGEDENRPGIVHRLDRDVSGLMVVARSQKMFKFLKKQFSTRKVEKEYIALVLGKVKNAEGTIDFPIARSKESGKMAARARTEDLAQDEKEAISEYELIEYIKNYSFLKVRIKTGRTHQIRVHMNALGHPVAGETIYLPKKFRIPRKWQGFERLFLHSKKLGFEDLKGDFRQFESNLPLELEEFMEKI